MTKEKNENTSLTDIPILPLRNNVLYPGVVMPLVIGRPKSLQLFQSLESNDDYLGVITQREA